MGKAEFYPVRGQMQASRGSGVRWRRMAGACACACVKEQKRRHTGATWKRDLSQRKTGSYDSTPRAPPALLGRCRLGRRRRLAGHGPRCIGNKFFFGLSQRAESPRPCGAPFREAQNKRRGAVKTTSSLQGTAGDWVRPRGPARRAWPPRGSCSRGARADSRKQPLGRLWLGLWAWLCILA